MLTGNDRWQKLGMLTEDEWPMLFSAKQLWQSDDLREENRDGYHQLVHTTDCSTQIDG